MIDYDLILSAASAVIKKMAPRNETARASKFKRFARGQREVMTQVKGAFEDREKQRPVAWLHAASLGEAAIARPLIKRLKEQGYEVVMTFFSPSGYEPMSRETSAATAPDHIFYLPLDTRRNASRFLDLVKPDVAAFMVSEYWLNYLTELHRRDIPVYLVSAKINDDSAAMRRHGFLQRRCLKCFSHIFVLDDDSRRNLASIGIDSASISGNPLFDNAAEKAAEQRRYPAIERFIDGAEKVFVAGSVHDSTDAKLVTSLANRHPEVKFIIVPHDLHPHFIAAIEAELQHGSVRYTALSDAANPASAQCLIVDTIGMLAYIYRYGTMAYVGGGFTPLLHSLIEATAYGIPVAFGPQIQRKVTPRQLMERGLGQMVTDAEQLDRWFTELIDDQKRLDDIRTAAERYIADNTHATNAITDTMLNR